MNYTTTTTWKAKLIIGAVTIAIVAGLLELVTSGFMYPAPEAVATRQQVITMQASQVEKARELRNGEVKAAEVSGAPRI